MTEPVDLPPKSRRISKDEIPTVYRRYQKVGPSIGLEKTFIEEVWDDDRFWNNHNVWGS